MDNHAVPSVTIDEFPDYKPCAFRARNDSPPPASIVLHDEAKWFLDRARGLNQGIGFCGIMTVADPTNSQPAMIYLWPLQTPHTIEAGVTKNVKGMEDIIPWPVEMKFPDWADALKNNKAPALKFFRKDDKNLHVIPAADPLPRAPAHEQLQQAIQALEHTEGLSIIGFSLYYNLADASSGGAKALKHTPNHHLLRCLSRSQNRKYFKYPKRQDVGKVPDNWATAMKQAFDAYFTGAH